MSYARKLLRSLDTDLIDRLEAGGTIERRKPVKAHQKPRSWFTYRQNGRDPFSSVDPWASPKTVVKDGSFKGRIRLNTTQSVPLVTRSQHDLRNHRLLADLQCSVLSRLDSPMNSEVRQILFDIFALTILAGFFVLSILAVPVALLLFVLSFFQ